MENAHALRRQIDSGNIEESEVMNILIIFVNADSLGQMNEYRVARIFKSLSKSLHSMIAAFVLPPAVYGVNRRNRDGRIAEYFVFISQSFFECDSCRESLKC